MGAVMTRKTMLMLALAAAVGAANAQTPVGKQADYASYVEDNRPQPTPRKLSGADRAQMSKAIAAWKRTRAEADLPSIRPYAEAGEVEALRAMFEGYGHLLTGAGKRGASDALQQPEFGLKPLHALWGIAYGRVAGPSAPIVGAMAECTKDGRERTEDGSDRIYFDSTIVVQDAKTIDFDCGFTLRGTQAQKSRLFQVRDKEPRKGPFATAIIERPATAQATMDEAKLPKVLEDIRLNKATYGDRQWATGLSERDPALKEKLNAARLEARLYYVEQDGKPLSQDEGDLWTYMMADTKRQYAHAIALSRNFDKTSASSQRFANAMATGNFQEREWSSWIAVRNNQTANQWWNVYRGNVSGSVPSLDQWCGVGIGAACDQIRGQQMAQEFRDRYGDPASLNSGRFAGASGSINQDQFAKERADAKAACLAANVNNGAGCAD